MSQHLSDRELMQQALEHDFARAIEAKLKERNT